jgi:hypothetical protein
LDGIFEVRPLGPDDVAARTDQEVRIDLVLRGYRGPDLSNHFGLRYAPSPGHSRRLLGRLLVFDVHGGDPGPDELLHGKMNVHRVPVTGVAVDQDWDRGARSNVAGMIYHVP